VREGKGNICSAWTERLTFICEMFGDYILPFRSFDMFLVLMSAYIHDTQGEENEDRSRSTCISADRHPSRAPSRNGVLVRGECTINTPNSSLRYEMKNGGFCLTFAGRCRSSSTWARESHTFYSKVRAVTSYVSSTPRSVQYRNLSVQGRPSTKMPTVEVSSRVLLTIASTNPTGTNPRNPKDCLQRSRRRHQDRSNRQTSQVV
jgi:hypothetical protein